MKLAKLPARLWSISHDFATMITDGSHRQPSKAKLMLIRIAAMAMGVALAPVAIVFSSRYRRASAFDALDAQVRQTWQTSAAEAIALLRSIYQQLVAAGAFSKMKAVEVAPFGKFTMADVLAVYRFRYDCEFALGNFEDALAVLAAIPGRLEVTILQQVDCLVALGRREEAIALLERNLDIDGWRGRLRRRLRELGGRHLRALP
jgi:tetratricopeptide (TPR) repeat protein